MQLWIIFVMFMVSTAVILILFKEEIRKHFSAYLHIKQQDQNSENIIGLEFTKSWSVDEDIIGGLMLKTSAETSKQAQQNMDYLMSLNLRHDQLVSDKKNKKKYCSSIG